MPVAALVVTLDADPTQQRNALLSLTADVQVTLGRPNGLRLPVVIEGNDDQDTLIALQRAERTVGVVLIEVVSVDFSDVDTSTEQ
jgi:nitrate reductase NapAB chaperone NapD